MEKQESIDAWFALVPEQAKATARQLLLEVDNLRREEIIYPPQGDILNALAYVAPEDVRAVILGQDPYHGPGQAMGLSFSVPKGEKLPPSLRNIYKEMASDLGCGIPVSGDLSAWAQQGVLLLNTTLTVPTASWAGRWSRRQSSRRACACLSRWSFWRGGARPSS